MASSSHGQPALPEQPAAASDSAAPVQATQRFTRFVPLTANGTVPRTVFSVEMTAARPDRNLDGVAQLGPAWVRRNGLLWKDVEPVEGGGYRWTAPSVAALEQEMISASERGLKLILVVRGSPRWATEPYQGDCGPINPAKYRRFAEFMAAAVKRYSQWPFNVRYWELGNEPDAPVGADSVYGCWGISKDPYFGGRAYGNMLKAVYPAIKAANPNVSVLNGSLLLESTTNAQRARFFEGMLIAGAANSFDILGFHSYCMHDPNNPDGHDVHYKNCASDWKLSFLRTLTAKYGVPNKPMMRTEAGLLCNLSVPAAVCRAAQADFVARHYARTARDGVLNSIWYSYDGDWQQGALVEPSNPFAPRPSYIAMKHAAAMFGGAQYAGALTGQPTGVEGYRFRRIGQSTTVVWSNTAQTASIPVAAGVPVACSGRDGQPIDCVNSGGAVTLSVGPSPVFVVSP